MELDRRLIANALGIPLPTGPVAPGPCIPESVNPSLLWTSILEGIAAERSIILADPGWPAAWKAVLIRQAAHAGIPPSILLATSGSTSLPKWCQHDLASLSAAAYGFASRYGKGQLPHAVVVLPQHHVGGILPVLRSAACQGKVHFADYRHPQSFLSAPFPLRQASLSLVPTQLSRILTRPEGAAVLREFGAIFVGGASCPTALLDQASRLDIPLAPCYGATETAAMVTALDPEAFLNGQRGVGQALPHARVSLTQKGRLQIQSAALFRGYLGDPPPDSPIPESARIFLSSDSGRWDENGSLHILARTDRVLISGGELVHPEAVEAAVREALPGCSVTCIGREDPLWGQRVEVVISLPQGLSLDEAVLLEVLRERLPPAAVPKQFHLRSNPLKS